MQKKLKILLIDDSIADARLVIEALKDSDIKNELFHVKNGVEAIRFLTKEIPYHKAPSPNIILLDLNMPLMDGRQVLKKINKEPSLNMIPIIVLTTSESQKDIADSYSLQANCYISKPSVFEEFVEVIRSIGCFWGAIVQLPMKE